MATTFDVIYLGVLADLDPDEGDLDAEGAGALVGLTLGSSGDPLYNQIQSFSPGTTGFASGSANTYDSNTTSDTFSIDGGADQTFDMAMLYNATITYADGASATAIVILAQDDAGNTYVVPWTSNNSNQAAIEAGPIESITLGSTVPGPNNGYGLTADRYQSDIAGPVDGTSGDDVMMGGYQDADGDAIDGSDGLNDIIYGGGGNDTINGGVGSDTIDAGIGDDTVIVDGDFAGDDTLDGGDGVDTLILTPDDDRNLTVDMTAGTTNDGQLGAQDFSNFENVTTGGGNDSITGDVGDNVIDAGAGNDTLDGGAGNDTLDGGAGADTLTGGDGADVFIADGTADTITDFDTTTGIDGGGSGDNDFVDLSGFYNQTNLDAWNLANPGQTYATPLGWLRADQADGTLGEAGNLVIARDNTAVAASELNAENTGVVCYVAGTRILTPRGEVEIESLSPGDEVMTRDNGAQKVRWIGITSLECTEAVAPIHIRAGALGEGYPRRDLLVSPQHRILVRSKIVERMTGNREALVAATKLQSMAGICKADWTGQIKYVHLMCDAHEIIYAEGAPSETLLPGPQARVAMGPDAWTELTTLCPEIADCSQSYPPARKIPSNAQQKNLARRHQKNDVGLLESV